MTTLEHDLRSSLALVVAGSLSACSVAPRGSIAACKPTAQVVAIDAPPATVSYDVREISPGPVGLSEATGIWTGTEYLIFGGFDPAEPRARGTVVRDREWEGSSSGTTWTTPGYGYNPVKDRWRKLPGKPIYGTSGTDPVAWHCGRALVLNRYGQGFRYHVTRGSLDPISSEGSPGFCRGRILRTHGPYAIIWGCNNCGAHVYDRRSDEWFEIGGTPPGAGEFSCTYAYENIVGDRFVALLGDGSGAYWEIGSEAWQTIAAPEEPMAVDSGPVGDADAVYVVGRRGQEGGVYRYDFRTSQWWRESLIGGEGLCLGWLAGLSDGVLIVADSHHERHSFSCAYDLANATQVGHMPPSLGIEGGVVILGDDQIFVWSSTHWTYPDGEMPERPLVGIDNSGWVIDVRVER